MSAVVGPAAREDLQGILSLLGTNGLPPDGLEEHLGSTIVARESGRVVGGAAVELHGSHVLLRSVVVDGGYRGRGLGRRMKGEALELARTAVPEPVRGSVEFVSACPASARAMSADLWDAGYR